MKLIRSRDNPQFKHLRRLAESGKARRQTGQTLIDGEHLITSWLATHGAVDLLICSETIAASPSVPDTWLARDRLVLADSLIRELGLVDTPTGILAMVTIPTSPAIRHDTRSVLLDAVQDPGNVGSILRSAAAAGFRQMLLAPGCASAWSPRVLRAGQGAHCVVDIHENVDLDAFAAGFSGEILTTSLEATASLFNAQWSEPVAWIFGAEGSGVRPSLQAAATQRVIIPMPGQVESLNVGAAAAICLFESVRRLASLS